MRDKEIKTIEDDLLNIQGYIEDFINKYIRNDYSGTILINGKWGAGKSSYLNLVKEKAKKLKVKFVDINFWQEAWDEKPFAMIYKKNFPITFWISRLFPVLISIFMVGAQVSFSLLNTDILSTFNTGLYITILLILVTGVSTYTIDNYSLESFYKTALTIRFKIRFNSKKLILVCDDFDRVDINKRKQIYSVINTMNKLNKPIIIVLADYERLISNPKDDSIMLQKILNSTMNLPKEYSSHNVWTHCIKSLENKISENNVSQSDIRLLDDLKRVFMKEHRNFREAILLISLFNREYFSKREGKVNISEFLCICYIYVFYNPLYTWLITNIDRLYLSNMILNEQDKSSFRNIYI